MAVYQRSFQPRPWVKAILAKPKVIVTISYKYHNFDFYEGFTAVFTNLGKSGTEGPDSVGSHYTGQDHDRQVTVSGGIQLWTVPQTGEYRIETIGASGGYSEDLKDIFKLILQKHPIYKNKISLNPQNTFSFKRVFTVLAKPKVTNNFLLVS